MGQHDHRSRRPEATRPRAAAAGGRRAPIASRALDVQRAAGNAVLARAIVQRQPLTAQQQRVVSGAKVTAKKASGKARKKLLKKAKELGISPADLELIKSHIRKAELTINFEASKMIGSKSIAELLEETGEVKNRFETGTSGGSADFTGREKVERELFGYSKITEDASSMAEKAERPRYAAANPTTSALGAADTSTYGMSALVLNEAVRARTTITADDTFVVAGPEQVGTFDDLDHVLLIKLSSSEGKDFAETILAHAKGQRADTKGFGYMETQVHGKIDIARDVAYIRANFNEAFGTDAGKSIMKMADTKPVIWSYVKKRDQMVLQPTKGPPAAHFLRVWLEVKKLREDAEAAKKPLPTFATPHPVLAKKWNELLAVMPPANIDAWDAKRAELGQLSGRKKGDVPEDITAEEVKALLAAS